MLAAPETTGPPTDLVAGDLAAQDSPPRPFMPTVEQLAVIRHRRGRLRVLAGPGTGKTTTIAASVAARIADGADPASILVLTFARRAAAALASRIAGMVETTTVEPMVRTLHSFSYALVRARSRRPAANRRHGCWVRAKRTWSSVTYSPGTWRKGPVAGRGICRPALAVPGFAAELREFLLRCAEREISPRRLTELAGRHHRPQWRAVAEFIREYRQVSDLRQAGGRFGTALDQAELTVAALERLSDPDVLAAAQRRIRRIFVDEYQDVDPAQARLIKPARRRGGRADRGGRPRSGDLRVPRRRDRCDDRRRCRPDHRADGVPTSRADPGRRLPTGCGTHPGPGCASRDPAADRPSRLGVAGGQGAAEGVGEGDLRGRRTPSGASHRRGALVRNGRPGALAGSIGVRSAAPLATAGVPVVRHHATLPLAVAAIGRGAC